jgi:hypothetical protein
MQYGFQRLALLGSAGYSRAELPLDGAVSLVAPNNTGKTSLINALQFLLIIDRRRMDFGAHDVDKSRRFYFPNNSAYVLLEVSLPESGTVVLGCVGKGVSFDYEYFAYSGQLNIDEFCLPNGNIVAQPQLASHLAGFGRRVFSYDSSGFADMVYGVRNRKATNQQNFCVFSLEHASDASVFRQVLTRTLRLDKLKSSEVKEYLLQIFRRHMPDASIDFKAEWDRAFAEVNADRDQYLAAERLKGKLDTLGQKNDERLSLRGKLICLHDLIDDAMKRWQPYYESHQEDLQRDLKKCDADIQNLRKQDEESASERTRCEIEQKDLQGQSRQLQALRQRFELITDRLTLEDRRRELQEQRDGLVVKIGQAQGSTPKSIEREMEQIAQKSLQLEQELRTHGQNLYQHLASSVSAEQLDALNRVLAVPVMTLSQEDFHLDEKALRSALSDMDAGQVNLCGLQLRLESLPVQHRQRTLAEIDELQQDLRQRRDRLQEQLDTARDIESVVRKRDDLDQQLKEIDAEIREYLRMQDLAQGEDERQARMQELSGMLDHLGVRLSQSAERYRALDDQRQRVQQKLAGLQQKSWRVEQESNKRIDQEKPFTWLKDLPYIPWYMKQEDFDLEKLADHLRAYNDECRTLLELDSRIRNLLDEIHAEGLTRYQFLFEPEDEIVRLVEFSRNLPQEDEALKRKERSAVVNVAAGLRELHSGLESFRKRIDEFNRKISGRRLSDLSEFKIEIREEKDLVGAIEILTDAASKAESGENLNLFNQQRVFGDSQIDAAKNLLIREGNARNGLRMSDLFHLGFKIGKSGRKPEFFDDIDSAASNGTVLMAKLVTGLAMLHMMQSQRHPIQGVCYLDEALALDARNQRSLIDTAAEFGFSLIFASPAPLTTARYCVPIHTRNGTNQISRHSWQIIEQRDA